ncbi:ankyrin repeat protein [Purpureocillium lavendulum]|uniref:Ankyrin repeat protein n=1 Tax=Purpureocillium lavendulum TaxID=1247861 RepID=A0AB34FS04_9HYPO|nr:ankyrin repeat protein [Purpureocillium lavendulum]
MAVMELVPSLPGARETALLNAAQSGELELVRDLLAEHRTLVLAREHTTGRTSLHLAVINNHEAIVQLLLESGANVEAADNAGWRPLALAASGASARPSLNISRLLLEYGANVEAVNAANLQSALHCCTDAGQLELAQVLLDNGAQVDFRDVNGWTALLRAVVNGYLDMIRLLLQYGADIDVRASDGQTAERLARSSDALRILKSTQLLRGPEISSSGSRPVKRKTLAPAARIPPQLEDIDKQSACHAFKVSVVEFFIGDTEQRIHKTASVYDMIYGIGANAIMNAARQGNIESKPAFRWYHLPANNTAPSTSTGRIAAFVPYLHYETQRGFSAMVESISRALPRRRPKKTAKFKLPESDGDNATGTAPGPSLSENRNRAPSMVMTSGALHELLLKGYLKTSLGEVPPLQARRTLDQYFYTHLGSTAKRDADQVVLRYTSNFAGSEPKIFMVDQLWLWMLDEDTVISCCSMRWDSWTVDASTEGTHPTSWDDFKLVDGDPLNVFQNTIRYLRNVRRPSITTARDFCSVITSFCLAAFDPQETPEEFRFFDFIERSIGDVSDQTAERLREFRSLLDATAATNEFLSAEDIRIEQETKLLVDIEDIRDELGILRSVLEDQQVVVEDLYGRLRLNTSDEHEHYSQGKRGKQVQASHLARLDRMETLTNKAVQSLPLSFITSFFTIPIAAFPYNDKDKMPVGFILGIICKLELRTGV